jgi:hypothetical protein
MSYWIGPVELVDLYEPSLTFTGTPTALGLQPGQITGQTEWWQAHQLKELVNNPQRRVTIGGQSGVLEPIYFSDPMLGPLTSWCLLQSFQLGQADQSHSLQGKTGLVPYTLALTQVGDATQRQVVLTRSARSKGNDFGLSAFSMAVNPFWDEDVAGSAFITDPGGTRVSRPYDPAFPHSTARLTAAPRAVTLYTAPFTGSTDGLALVTLPALSGTSDPPEWVSERGGDVRGWDRSNMREVYGASHRWAAETDIEITNGLVRFWVGNRGLPPFLNVQALGTSWGETGYLHLADPEGSALLTGARVIKITPEEAVVVLSVQGQGNVTVTLRRGERMFRITHGDGVSALRRIQWGGLPPWERLERAGQGTGKFGKGVKSENNGGATWADPEATWADPVFTWGGEYGLEPDFRLRWPVGKTGWTLAWWYTADQAVGDEQSGGQWTVTDDIGGSPVRINFDTGTNRFTASIGATTLQSSVQTFAAGQNIFLALSRDSTGIVVTVGDEHVTSSATDDGTTGNYSGLMLGVGSVPYDTGLYGVGPYGGRTLPDGVVSDVGIWRRALTTTELDALAAATTRFDNLPDPEGDLVWYTSFDPRPIVRGSAFASGRRY